MQLNHLKFDCCPSCGERVVSEHGHAERHSNGQWFEMQTFACGMRHSWIPNFSRVTVDHPCPRSPASKKFGAQKDAAKEVMLKVIETLDLPPSTKNDLACSVGNFFKYVRM